MAILPGALGLVGFVAGGLLVWLLMRQHQAFNDLDRRVGDLEQQIQKPRHTHRTIAGLEDATALVIDLMIEAQAMQARLDTVRRVLGKTREGPESYQNSEWESHRGDTKDAEKSKGR